MAVADSEMIGRLALQPDAEGTVREGHGRQVMNGQRTREPEVDTTEQTDLLVTGQVGGSRHVGHNDHFRKVEGGLL
ncbi:hypothetical protein [Yimella lutea]|uniref:hypothetical protein n=1 Tax=Yimella lutea TaxID=587872 RepID=UPI001476D4A2|nr:hypothetical protein [Yimella lutea]